MRRLWLALRARWNARHIHFCRKCGDICAKETGSHYGGEWYRYVCPTCDEPGI